MKFMNALTKNGEIVTIDEGQKGIEYLCPECEEASLIWVNEYDSIYGPVNAHFKTKSKSNHKKSCDLNRLKDPEICKGEIQIGALKIAFIEEDEVEVDKIIREILPKRKKTESKYNQLVGVLKYLMGYEEVNRIKAGNELFKKWDKIHFAANLIHGYANREWLDDKIVPFYSGKIIENNDGTIKVAISKIYESPSMVIKTRNSVNLGDYVFGKITSIRNGVTHSRMIKITDEENKSIHKLIERGVYGFKGCCDNNYETRNKYPNLSKGKYLFLKSSK